MRALFSLFSLALLVGCGPTGWQQPLAGRAQQQADLASCSEAAQREAVSAAPHLPPDNPAAEVPQELLIQQSLRNECMRECGWSLGSQTAEAP